MSDPRVAQILEEIIESGLEPEEICKDHPDLLPEVRQRLRAFHNVEAQLEDLFPSTKVTSGRSGSDRLRSLDGKLPQIPGYEVQRLLGHGGMGVVYQARHLKLNRTVALKMLLSGVYASAIERARFMREAEVVACFSHPNVVQLHDAGEYDGHLYFTMEYLEGGTLARELTGTPRPVRESAELIALLADAVEIAHKAGIVHRDLKPGNILRALDGTPKITDFGLARRVNEDAAMTLAGLRIGTPSYMAPEQASGNANAIGPSADIYALGAILFELLTGRPPFRAETAFETERLLLSEDPVAPSRLNSKVPRDLETICLKCLYKDPHRRYGSALALAQDLRRFLRSEPIEARPTGLFERAAKWTRRHPTLSVAALGCLILSLFLIGGGTWLAARRPALASAVNTDLNEVKSLQEQARWAQARTALERAEARLGSGGPAELRQRCAQSTRDLDLVMKLDEIRLEHVMSDRLVAYNTKASWEYARAFDEAKLGTALDDPSVVAARVDASILRPALVAALDDWALCASETGHEDWVLKTARLADADASGWASRTFDRANWHNPAALADISGTIPLESQSLSLTLSLAQRMTALGVDAPSFLEGVQDEHPGDFWVNLILGNSLLYAEPFTARNCYRAAIASRPDEPVGYCAVADTQRLQGNNNEAIRYYWRAIHMNPNYARAYCNLALTLQEQGKLDQATIYYRKSIELDPNYAWSYYNLGYALQQTKGDDEALQQYHKTVALDPLNPPAENAIRMILIHRGRIEEVWKAWHDIIKTDPPRFDDWWGYPELTLYLGKVDEYREARDAILNRYGDSTDALITEKIGRACLMLPASPAQQRAAATLTNRALQDLSATQYRPYYAVAQALADYRGGDLDGAVLLLRGSALKVLGPSPKLILAMVQFRQGKTDAARKTFSQAVTSFDWSLANADERDNWFAHILRREAETLIFPSLPAFLEGKYQPKDNTERLSFLGVCEFDELHATEARLLKNAVAADPTLFNNIYAGLRARAAKAAALAGTGQGKDVAKLEDTERAASRGMALNWLESDLAELGKMLHDDSPRNHDFVAATLGGWQHERNLAQLRDTEALQRLPQPERDQWIAFWSEVAELLKHT